MVTISKYFSLYFTLLGSRFTSLASLGRGDRGNFYLSKFNFENVFTESNLGLQMIVGKCLALHNVGEQNQK